MIPDKVEVRQAEHWKKKDTTKIKDFTKIEVVSDWTFSTPYKGTYSFASAKREQIKNSFGLSLPLTISQ